MRKFIRKCCKKVNGSKVVDAICCTVLIGMMIITFVLKNVGPEHQMAKAMGFFLLIHVTLEILVRSRPNLKSLYSHTKLMASSDEVTKEQIRKSLDYLNGGITLKTRVKITVVDLIILVGIFICQTLGVDFENALNIGFEITTLLGLCYFFVQSHVAFVISSSFK